MDEGLVAMPIPFQFKMVSFLDQQLQVSLLQFRRFPQEQVVWLVCAELALSVTNGRRLVWQELKKELKDTLDCLGHDKMVTRTVVLVP